MAPSLLLYTQRRAAHAVGRAGPGQARSGRPGAAPG